MSDEMAMKVSSVEKKRIPHLLTVRQYCVQHPWPSESAMRSYIYRAEELRLSDAFIRVGRRVLIDVDKFFELIQMGRQDCE